MMLPRRLLLALAATCSALIARSACAMPDGTEVALPGVRLFVRDTGGNGTPVILLHANTGTSASWAEQFEAMSAAGYRVIAFDRRGWGRSLPDPAGPQPGSVAEDLAALVDHLRLPPFHLLGVAGGGFVALDYAAWRPETLRGLVVAASTGSFSEPEMEQMTRNLDVPGFRQLPESFVEIGPSFRATQPERTATWLAAEETARQKGARPQPLRTPNTFAKAEAIRTPLLVISASADLLAPPSLMRGWVSHMRQAEWVAIADAGHSVPMEQPELFNRAVLDFLRRH
ncbi:alpha/beta hydrolase [Roseomonas sp. KE2513]|uniref:alpha/beta fold hydrolase n=1 Tax=Roseomonas sp. KE2513 TaxID=2479202 RepID=UPI0018E0295C|nr:alpha/beta hydrolase [Roseomonas sp. KE2513]MBI0537236.1 alpha/beta hydrolase [Roseomonas sp. KE2513]